MTDHVKDDGIDDGDDGIIVEDHPLVPDGIYTMTYTFHETVLFQDKPKVVVHLCIVDDESWAGLELCRYYGVRSFRGRPRRFGGFTAGGNSDLTRELRRCLADQNFRGDRISLRRLKGRRIKARTCTVKVGGYKIRKPLHESCYYSRVAELIEFVDEEETAWNDQYQVATGSSEGITS